MKLIDVDEAIINFGFEWDDIGPSRGEVVEFLRKQPTIDAVPVVRCLECKHRETVDCPMCHEEYYFDEDDGGDYSLWTRVVDPNGFCSCGERKEGAD